MLRDNAPKVSSIPPLCAINHRMHPSDRVRETVSGIFRCWLESDNSSTDPGKLALVREALMIPRPSRAHLPANDMRPLLAQMRSTDWL